jgi:hypothetical protein
MKFLCKFLTTKVIELGKMEAEITLAGVDRMFLYVAHSLVPGKYKLFYLFPICILYL